MRANEVDKENTVIMEYERKQYIKEHTELEYTNALRKLGRKKDPIIYHTVGHLNLILKANLQGEAPHYKCASSLLDQFKPLDLLARNAVPQDADMLVLWGQSVPF